MTAATAREKEETVETPARRWTFSVINLLIAILLLAGVAALLYPSAAQWISQYNQSRVIVDQQQADKASGLVDAREELARARAYNATLDGAAAYEAGSNIATGTGKATSDFDYFSLLTREPTGMMARLTIPSIDVDLPVFHGTSDETLLRGVGHLQGTALPVGGQGTRSVLTAHRGLASATLFSHLDQVEKGETFSLEVLGEVLTYRVFDIRVVEPDQTEMIRPIRGRDLVTLVTCTPLGINSHRILVTGERVIPTPQEDIDAAGDKPRIPTFPWWALMLAAAITAIGLWYWRSGYPSRRSRRAQRT